MSKKELLRKPYWTNQDIQEYFGIGPTKASEIRQCAAAEGGVNQLFPRLIRRDTVLLVLGIDRQEELDLLQIVE